MVENVKIDEIEKLCKGDFKKLPQCFNPGRERYIRKADASLVYPLGRHSIDDVAERAGAVIPIKGCILYDTERINKYIDSFRVDAM